MAKFLVDQIFDLLCLYTRNFQQLRLVTLQGQPDLLQYLCSSAKREFSFRHNRICIRALLFELFFCGMSE